MFKNKLTTLKAFIHTGVKQNINLKKESYSKEIRLITSMLN